MHFFSLEFVWYVIIGFCIVFYTVLDGFDLGVGSLHLFAKKDEDRRIFLNAIGPVWDGNEVWLVVIIGALFAGFPNAYATLLSGFYVLNMVLIAGLIFRAVAIEFRSKQENLFWRKVWDVVFAVSSIAISFLIGIVFGNLITGVPLDENGDLLSGFKCFFTPYSILLGITTVALFTMHGAIFLIMKTEGALHNQLRGWVKKTILFFVISYTCLTLSTAITQPHMLARMREYPYLFAIAAIAFLIIANIPREIHRGNDGWAFLSSCSAIALLVLIFGVGTYPNLIRSSKNPGMYSLTVQDAASSPLTLKILLVIAGIGVPLVLAYGFYIYRTFRGKVRLGPTSY